MGEILVRYRLGRRRLVAASIVLTAVSVLAFLTTSSEVLAAPGGCLLIGWGWPAGASYSILFLQFVQQQRLVCTLHLHTRVLSNKCSQPVRGWCMDWVDISVFRGVASVSALHSFAGILGPVGSGFVVSDHADVVLVVLSAAV